MTIRTKNYVKYGVAYLTSDIGTKKKITIGNPSRALEKRAGLLIFWLQYALRGER